MRICLALFISVLAIQAAHWNQFRGPEGTGHTKADLPLTWSETENVAWKTAIPGRGWSSPVLWENQIWLTTATPDGKQLTVLCLNALTGKILHQQKLFDVAEPQFAHKFNSYASPTPVVEAGRAYVSWGSPGTACIDTKTFKVLWTRRDLDCDHFRGAGSSPILWNNLLINNHDGADAQYVFALDKQTGKTVWETPRSVDFQDLDPEGKPKRDGDMRKGYSTPHIITLNGKPTLLSSGAMAHYAYDPADGRELWACGGAQATQCQHASRLWAMVSVISQLDLARGSYWLLTRTAKGTPPKLTSNGVSPAAVFRKSRHFCWLAIIFTWWMTKAAWLPAWTRKPEKKFGANDWAAITPHLQLWPTAGFMPLARKENPSSLPLPRKVSKSLPKTN